MEDKLDLHRKVVEISGPRNLYYYTFTEDGVDLSAPAVQVDALPADPPVETKAN